MSLLDEMVKPNVILTVSRIRGYKLTGFCLVIPGSLMEIIDQGILILEPCLRLGRYWSWQ